MNSITIVQIFSDVLPLSELWDPDLDATVCHDFLFCESDVLAGQNTPSEKSIILPPL
jgi:hypothetical protein